MRVTKKLVVEKPKGDYSVYDWPSLYSAAKFGHDDAALEELDRRRGYHIDREKL